jgi:hypothetical protein
MVTEVPETPFANDPAYQAYRILHVGFTILPIIAGLDKFFHLLVNWDMYLAPLIARVSPLPALTLMSIEIIAGILVPTKPRIGAYVVMARLWGIIVDLLLLSRYYDVDLRDLGLSPGALALERLSKEFDK